jgi:transposase
MHVIGEDRSQRLDVIPAQYQVIVTRRPKYACRACQEAVVQAPAPARLIEGGLPTERLVAHVAVAKYADHCPLYRQAQILARQGIAIDRATLAFWVGYLAAEIKPVWRLMREDLLGSTKLFVDETTAPVLDPGRGRTKKGYFWVLARDDRPWRGAAPPAVVYSYAPGRGGDHAVTLLQGYTGVLQTDGYAAYRRPRRSQARRRTGHARLLLGTLAQAVVRHRQIAPGADRRRGPEADRRTLRNRSRDPRQERRPARRGATAEDQTARRSAEGLAREDPAGGSSITQAIRYALGRWDGLVCFLDDGRIEIDSNTSSAACARLL